MLLLAGIGVWITQAETPPREPWQGPLAMLGAWLAVQLLSPGPSLDTLAHLSWLLGLAAFFLLARYAWGPKQKDLFLSSVIGAGLANALLLFIQKSRDLPAMGLFSGNPNYSAALTAAAILLCGVRFKRKPLFCGTSLALLAVSFSCQESRGAWLGLAAGALSLAFRRWKIKGVLLAVAILILWISLTPGHYAFRLTKAGDGPDALARPLLWKSTLEMIQEKPLAGWGAGRFEQGFLLHPAISRDGLFRYEKTTAFAHSLYLQTAADLGIPALIFFLWTLASLWKSTDPNSESRPVLVACLVQAGFDMVFALPGLSLLFAGIAATMAPKETGSPSFRLLPRTRTALCAGVVGMAVFSLFPIRKDVSSDPGFWEDRAFTLGQVHRWGEAFLAYQKAEDLSPFHAPLYCEAGELALACGEPLRAEREFRQCLKLEPNALKAWRGLTVALRQEGRKPEADRLEISTLVLTRRIQKQIEMTHQKLSNYALYLL
jgi:O-antigen ligase